MSRQAFWVTFCVTTLLNFVAYKLGYYDGRKETPRTVTLMSGETVVNDAYLDNESYRAARECPPLNLYVTRDGFGCRDYRTPTLDLDAMGEAGPTPTPEPLVLWQMGPTKLIERDPVRGDTYQAQLIRVTVTPREPRLIYGNIDCRSVWPAPCREITHVKPLRGVAFKDVD